MSFSGPSLVFVITNSLYVARRQGLMSAIVISGSYYCPNNVKFYFFKFTAQNDSILKVLEYSCTKFSIYWNKSNP